MAKPFLQQGRVVDPKGQPVSEVMVSVEWGTAPTPEIAIQTNDQGEFRLALPKGRFRLAAHAPDGRSATLEVAIEDAGSDLVIRLGP